MHAKKLFIRANRGSKKEETDARSHEGDVPSDDDRALVASE
jgi:hypothetical protein